MEFLSEAEQREVDELIFADKPIHAVVIYRSTLGYGINQGLEAVDARMQELKKLFPDRYPSDVQRIAHAFENLQAACAKETVTAIKGSWDADSRGDMIFLYAITDGPHDQNGYGLCQLRDSDRLKERAVELGEHLAASIGVPFRMDDTDAPFPYR